MRDYTKTASREIRRCMVLTANEKLREKLMLMLKEGDMEIYAPADKHNASGYLYDKHMDFLVIDVDCWDNRDWGCPGFEFAYKVRESFVAKPIIFLANDEGGKLYAYEQFNCVDYILKPVDKMPFLKAVDKALIFSEKTFLKIPKYVKSNSVYRSFYLDDIMYIDVYNRDVYFHEIDGHIIRIGNAHLNYYVEEAKKDGFIRIRRDIMVNTKYISNVDFNSKSLIIADGTELGIGSAYKGELEGYLKRHELVSDTKNNIKTIPIRNELGYTI
jgi:DNA-binding LytR/AlgR family response regulator